MMERFFPVLSEIYYRLFGSKRLLQHDKLCLDSWRNSLSDQAKAILDAQLAGNYFVQRQAAGAKICFYWNDSSLPLFAQKAPDLHVATVVLQTENGKQMPAKIYIHRGCFFSIEFPKRPERYIEQHGMRGLPLQLAEVKTHIEL